MQVSSAPAAAWISPPPIRWKPSTVFLIISINAPASLSATVKSGQQS
ncbi:MAG TPA: hypothetical protein VGK22_18410 [Candidatus Angelobacter sp.]